MYFFDDRINGHSGAPISWGGVQMTGGSKPADLQVAWMMCWVAAFAI
jgi:hypothetical protein